MALTKPPSPPKWVGKLLGYFLEGQLQEMAIGDLHEQFHRKIVEVPLWKARLIYIVEGLGLIRLKSFQKNSRTNKLILMDMLKNYFIISVRKMLKEKAYAVLNVLGLAIGVACFVLMFVYIQFELSYDKFHNDSESIYRITEEYEDDAKRVMSAMSHSPVAKILSENLSTIKGTVRILPYSAFISSEPDKKFKESMFCFADSLFFDVLSFKSVIGSIHTALDYPNSVVITESTAKKYFGDTHVIGKQITLEDESQTVSFSVTAVIADVPQNSHFNFNFIASFSTLNEIMPWHDNWQYPPMYVYLKASTSKLTSEMIKPIIERHQPDDIKQENRNYHVQPIDRIHLHSNLEFEWQGNSNYQYVKLFGVMGALILIIACINFMNLSTAQAGKRAREIGVRKTLGSLKRQLVGQFLSETLLYVLFATFVGLVIAEMMGRWILQEIIGKEVTVLSLLTWSNSLILIAFFFCVALLSGLYPAFFMASIPSASIIKGSGFPQSASKWSLRKALVMFQFIVSGLLMFTTAIVYWQVEFFKQGNLGFVKDEIVNVRLSDRFAQKNYLALKEQLLNQTNVQSVALSSALPGTGAYHGLAVKPEGADPISNITMKSLGVDEDFVSTYGISILHGRNFSKDIASDQTEAFILNASAARKLGWINPVGKEFEITVYIQGPVIRKGRIIGLIEDFHYQSLHNQIEPLILYINKHPYYAEYLSVKLKSGSPTEVVTMLQREWKAFHPEKPLDFQFLNDELNNQYQAETKLSQIFSTMMMVAITISILGLLGLSSYTASKRWKEMSIRKIFGANEGQVFRHLLREYMAIVLIANLIAMPVCWYWSKNWLENFPYHINMNWVWILIPVSSSAIITVVTVSFHSLKVARNNPVQAIKCE